MVGPIRIGGNASKSMSGLLESRGWRPLALPVASITLHDFQPHHAHKCLCWTLIALCVPMPPEFEAGGPPCRRLLHAVSRRRLWIFSQEFFDVHNDRQVNVNVFDRFEQ